jgi:hypothetical protein
MGNKKQIPSKKVRKPKLVLRDKIANQLIDAGYDVSVDVFGDNSGSWIEVRKPNIPGADRTLLFNLSFNGSGTEISDISMWKEIIDVVDTKRLF